MKTIFTIFSLLFFSLSFSQNLTINELISLREKHFTEVTEYLMNKNWEYGNENNPNGKTMGNISYSFDKQNSKSENVYFLSFYYLNNSPNRLEFQTLQNEKYRLYIAQMKSLGLKKIYSKKEKNKSTEIYQGKKVSIKASIETEKDNDIGQKTYYFFLVLSNNDYIKNFKGK